MTNPWFRMYTEAVDDEKLRLLDFADRWHFVAILCCKGKGILDEDSPLMRRKVAVKLGVSMSELEGIASRLAEVELIDEETLQPLAWDDRQFSSDHDPTRAERLRRFRENKKRTRNGRETDARVRVRNRVRNREENWGTKREHRQLSRVRTRGTPQLSLWLPISP